MPSLLKYLLLLVLSSLILACGDSESESEPSPTPASKPESAEEAVPEPAPASYPSREFKQYWYQGKAELTSFKLEQARYGEMREGYAIAVFVTEDFSRSRHVKLDYPEQAGEDREPVLKFNLNKRFVTGIYDYTLMQSVFTPVDIIKAPHSLRVTTSNIEWCGQFLTSARLHEAGYEVQYQSYFDGEEDLKLILPKEILEDEIWNLIRIAPEKLPQGDLTVIPGILTQELTHQKLQAERAIATLKEDGEDHYTYTLTYPRISRILSITFEESFPYRIVSWEETFDSVSGWGLESKTLTTRATRIKHTMSDYWNQKYSQHEDLRNERLGIETIP
ncbi:MAG: hypothetical protein AAF804_14625 [Bacteroidota bacterium]